MAACISFKSKRRSRSSVASFFYFLCFVLSGLNGAAFAQTAPGAKIAYKLSDPRNPACPCHKYQKLADREFKELTKKMITRQVGFSGRSGHYYFKFKRKRVNFHKKLLRFGRSGHRKGRKFWINLLIKRDIDACLTI